jgi:hypothetical protein
MATFSDAIAAETAPRATQTTAVMIVVLGGRRLDGTWLTMADLLIKEGMFVLH